MPVQIGAKTHHFTDPTGLLSDCHRRVEMFLGSLQAVAEVIGGAPTDETRQTLTAALRYFSQAAPKHTADEEESLFPRMRQIDDPEVRSAFATLDRLEGDHRRAAPWHAAVERIGEQYLRSGTLSMAEIAEFRSAVAGLAAMYREHIGVEDRIIFPLAARILSKPQQEAIAREMAARRDVPLVTDIAQHKA